MTKGIRGAITVEANTEAAIKSATVELLNEMIAQNNLTQEFARLTIGWDKVAMMCFNELDVPNSRRMCLRVLVVVNCDDDFVPKFVYLKGAKNLRSS